MDGCWKAKSALKTCVNPAAAVSSPEFVFFFFLLLRVCPLAEDGKNGREGGGMNLLTRTAVSGQVPDKQL